MGAFTANTGTVFDSPWFTAERPLFKKIEAQSDATLTFLLLIGGLIVIGLALWPKTPTVAKAIILAYITLP
ncbi:MAG: hypothetical protein P4M15_09490 [Alphaproteobacteria bacterium]|nr:hypothetical protein [Alphaproteobacteria bacterium]